VRLAWILLAASAVTESPSVHLPDTLAAPACVACSQDGEPSHDGLSEADWAAVSRGEILISETREAAPSDSERSVQVVGRIAAPPAEVWKVLADFESRPRWQPNAKEVRIVRTDENRVWVSEHMRFFLTDIRCQIINTLDPDHGSIRWVLDDSVAHDIRGSKGSWQLHPLAGRETLAVYRAWIDTGRRVPQFVQRFLLKRSLPQVIGDLRTEVGRRFGTH
jgi:uncharacterized protein YndB with AHSA1/START domain